MGIKLYRDFFHHKFAQTVEVSFDFMKWGDWQALRVAEIIAHSDELFVQPFHVGSLKAQHRRPNVFFNGVLQC